MHQLAREGSTEPTSDEGPFLPEFELVVLQSKSHRIWVPVGVEVIMHRRPFGPSVASATQRELGVAMMFRCRWKPVEFVQFEPSLL